jgi:hypothetical protein
MGSVRARLERVEKAFLRWHANSIRSPAPEGLTPQQLEFFSTVNCKHRADLTLYMKGIAESVEREKEMFRTHILQWQNRLARREQERLGLCSEGLGYLERALAGPVKYSIGQAWFKLN